MENAKYYILKPAVGTKETGMAYPAVESYDDYDFKGTNSVHKLTFREFPDFQPDIRFKLANGAQLCDLLGQSTINADGLLISEKAKLILEKFNTPSHKFFSAIISDKGIKHQYYWMHIIWKNSHESVDFNNTEFKIVEFGEVKERVMLNSYEEYLNKQKEIGFMKNLYAPNICMKPINFDIFPNPLNTGIYVNNTIKKELELNSISGIELSSNLGLFWQS